MQINKHTAMINYLLQNELIRNNPLYFNFGVSEDGNNHMVVNSSDVNLNQQYVDGGVLKRYTFTIINYQSVSYNAVVKKDGYPNENLQDIEIVQELIDWVGEQNDIYNFPDFGDECIIDEIKALSNMPNTNGVNASTTPNLVKYSIAIQVTYLDNTKTIFK